MKITWYGHACFRVETEGGSVVFDPYAPGKVPGIKLPEMTADEVICSHEHADHNYAEGIVISGRPVDFVLRQIPVFHDDKNGALRGSNLITVLEAEGMKLAHFGDLGHLLEEIPEELKDLDLAMIPVGGYYTIDAKLADQILQQLKPRVVIPMHYRGEGFGYDVIAPVENFLALRSDVRKYAGQEFTLTKETSAQTAVLECPLA